MFSIQRAQCIDYLLKIIAMNPASILHNKNPKLVINLNGTMWYGDFVQTNSNFIIQPYIDGYGDIEPKYFSVNEENSEPLFKTLWNAYSDFARRNRRATLNCSNFSLLFDTLVKITDDLELETYPSPLFPHLLNVKSFDGSQQLPFINLSGEDQIKLISIIESDSQFTK